MKLNGIGRRSCSVLFTSATSIVAVHYLGVDLAFLEDIPFPVYRWH